MVWLFQTLFLNDSPLLFSLIGLVLFLSLLFTHSDTKEARPEGIYWTAEHLGGLSTAHVDLASPTHYNVPSVSQLLHEVSIVPVYDGL